MMNFGRIDTFPERDMEQALALSLDPNEQRRTEASQTQPTVVQKTDQTSGRLNTQRIKQLAQEALDAAGESRSIYPSFKLFNIYVETIYIRTPFQFTWQNTTWVALTTFGGFSLLSAALISILTDKFLTPVSGKCKSVWKHLPSKLQESLELPFKTVMPNDSLKVNRVKFVAKLTYIVATGIFKTIFYLTCAVKLYQCQFIYQISPSLLYLAYLLGMHFGVIKDISAVLDVLAHVKDVAILSPFLDREVPDSLQEAICGVTFAPLIFPISTSCTPIGQHHFNLCPEVVSWLRDKGTCPSCRKDVLSDKVVFDHALFQTIKSKVNAAATGKTFFEATQVPSGNF